jgi:hypothetical protein
MDKPVFRKVVRGYMIYDDATGLAEIEKPLTEKQAKRYAKSFKGMLTARHYL